ncbi:MAG: hypothetical protein IPG61_03405 [bacterium]|nr:hypothetical protein [bacterium]
MNGFERVFDQLDRWRCLPDYQLERRADLYFSLYLPQVLESVLGKPFNPFVVPEFPIKQLNSNRSDKVDYLAANVAKTELVLVELKTDCNSTRPEQFEYLCRGAQKTGAELLNDLSTIRKTSKARLKYDALIAAAMEMGLTGDGAKMIGQNHPVVLISPREDFRGRDDAIQKFESAGVPFNVVTFERFRETVLACPDPLSVRFAASLDHWWKYPV